MKTFPDDLSRRSVLSGLAASAVAAPAFARAPLAGAPLRPRRFRGKIGAFEFALMSDGGFWRDNPGGFLATNAEAEAVSTALRAGFYATDRYEISFSPLILNTGREIILFDTGTGASQRPSAGHTREQLALVGLEPEQIDIVAVSHFHYDHIGGLMEEASPAFPNARYVASRAEFDFWRANEQLLDHENGVVKLSATLFRDNVRPLAERFTFLEPGQDVVTGVTALDAAGHTPGHLAFHLESDGQRLVVASDTAIHPAVSLARPDWHMIFDFDKELAVASRKRLFGMIAADQLPFSGYHMPFPNVGYVEAAGAGFRYAAASYQLSDF